MKYAKLKDGKPFPFFGFLDGKFKRNPSHEELTAAGYLPVKEQHWWGSMWLKYKKEE